MTHTCLQYKIWIQEAWQNETHILLIPSFLFCESAIAINSGHYHFWNDQFKRPKSERIRPHVYDDISFFTGVSSTHDDIISLSWREYTFKKQICGFFSYRKGFFLMTSKRWSLVVYRNLKEGFKIKVIPHANNPTAKETWFLCSETGVLLKWFLYLFCHSGDVVAFEKSTNYDSITQQEGTVSVE